MKHVTLAEAREKTEELFAEIEQGEVLTISKQGTPAQTPHLDPERRKQAVKALLELREMRKTAPKVTIEEILAWRHEGHKY